MKEKEIKVLILILISVDGGLELGAAILLISSNLYCTGLVNMPSYSNFNYCIVLIIHS
jgi:hypothetical protein